MLTVGAVRCSAARQGVPEPAARGGAGGAGGAQPRGRPRRAVLHAGHLQQHPEAHRRDRGAPDAPAHALTPSATPKDPLPSLPRLIPHNTDTATGRAAAVA